MTITLEEKAVISPVLSCSLAFPIFAKANLMRRQPVSRGPYIIGKLLFPMLIHIFLNLVRTIIANRKNFLNRKKNKIKRLSFQYLSLSYNSFLSWFYISKGKYCTIVIIFVHCLKEKTKQTKKCTPIMVRGNYNGPNLYSYSVYSTTAF